MHPNWMTSYYYSSYFRSHKKGTEHAFTVNSDREDLYCHEVEKLDVINHHLYQKQTDLSQWTPHLNTVLRAPAVEQWVKAQVFLQLWLRFSPWPEHFHMPWEWLKKDKIKSKKNKNIQSW